VRRDFVIDEAARSFRDHPVLFREVFRSEHLIDGAVISYECAAFE
jgi:hypothetical protein